MEIPKGDTALLKVSLINAATGQPFVPTNEKVVFSIGKSAIGKKYFSAEVRNGQVVLTHEMTNLVPGAYTYDVRVYNEDKTLVATPIAGELIIKRVTNDDL